MNDLKGNNGPKQSHRKVAWPRFSIHSHKTRRDRLVESLQKLHNKLSGCNLLQSSSDQECDSVLSVVADQVYSCIADLGANRDDDICSIVLLGRNGDGKSTFINLMLRATCQLDCQYGLKSLEDWPSPLLNRDAMIELIQKADDNVHTLEPFRVLKELGIELDYEVCLSMAIRYKLILDFCNLESAQGVVFNFPDENGLAPDLRRKEERMHDQLDKAGFTGVLGRKPNFLLPSSGRGNTTTPFCINVRFGMLFQLLVILKTEDEIRTEIRNMMSLISSSAEIEKDKNSPEYKNLQCIRKKMAILAGSWFPDPNFLFVLFVRFRPPSARSILPDLSRFRPPFPCRVNLSD